MKDRTSLLQALCVRLAAQASLRVILSFVILFSLAAPLPAGSSKQASGVDAFAIVGATVVDGTGREPFRGTVIVRDGRIASIGERVAVPVGMRVINADGRTLLPGLFDMHTHLPYATAPGITADWPKNLKAYLYCGVTSVVDFGTYPETFGPLRRLIASGAIESPRIHFAARFSTPGGHGAEGGRGDFFTLEVQTPREARAAVRRVMPYKPDVIKVFTDGWRYNTAPEMSSMNEETLAAIVAEAHKNGVEVMTHTVTLERAKIAVRAGIDALAHGVGDREVDEELIRLMRERGTAYVSTLAVYEPRGRDILSPLLNVVLDPLVRAQIDPPLTPAPLDDNETARSPQQPATPAPDEQSAARARANEAARRERWRNLLQNVAALKKAGVRFGAGTDAGVTGTHHGWASLRELELLVKGGLTPMQAITAATLESARALHVEAERGSIETGKLADLVLVEGEPHRRISDIERVERVFLGGREIERERLARDIASPELTPIAAVKLPEKIDDFEGGNSNAALVKTAEAQAREQTSMPTATGASPGGGALTNYADLLRSDLGTLWINSTDPSHDHSQVIYGRTLRKAGDHALSVLARMSTSERPFVRVSIPLTPGAIEPADARGWRGIRFDARGDGGEYRIILPTRTVRDDAHFQTSFSADGKWRAVKLDFAALRQTETKRPVAWTGTDLFALSFEIARAPSQFGWLELDNVRFYK